MSSSAVVVHLVGAIDDLQAIVNLGGDETGWVLTEGQWSVDNVDSDYLSLPAIDGYWDAMILLLKAFKAGVGTDSAVSAMLATRPALAAMDPTAFGTPVPTVAPAQPVVVKGKGTQKTKPFDMTGGDFTVTISGTGDGNVIASLELRGGDIFDGESLFNEIAYAKYKYETVVYEIAAGSYYLDVTNDNAWVVTFTPLQ